MQLVPNQTLSRNRAGRGSRSEFAVVLTLTKSSGSMSTEPDQSSGALTSVSMSSCQRSASNLVDRAVELLDLDGLVVFVNGDDLEQRPVGPLEPLTDDGVLK